MVGISIIIPTYKRVDQTRQTLKLLYLSKGWNVDFLPEVILVDSTEDATIKDLVQEFQNPIPLYIKPEKTGIAANKNAGAKTTKNELLVFCDSDMEVNPSDTLLNTLTYLKTHERAAMVGGKVIWKSGPQEGKLDRPRKEDRMETLGDTTYVEAIYSRYMATYKSIFDEVGGYDQEVFNMRGEGSDLSIRYWRSGYPLAYSDSIQVHHVFETEGATTRLIDHPERGIIRDLIQLGYKYGLSENQKSLPRPRLPDGQGQAGKIKNQNYNSKLKNTNSGISNFSKTLGWLTEQFGEDDKYTIIENVVSLLPYFWENREKIEKSRENIPNKYDFKFLDVFTKRELFLECVEKAQEKIKKVRQNLFI